MTKNIDLSNLIYKNNKINWVESSSKNCFIYFQYGDIIDNFKLVSYTRKTRNCEVEYNGKIFMIPSSSILKCNIGSLFRDNNDKKVKQVSIKKSKDDNKRNYCLYCHINRYNGKKYYGITSRKPSYRWNHGNGYSNNEYFTRAIQRYGWIKGFEHVIILDNLTQKEASELEKEYIHKYKTNLREYGYNLASGGIDEMIGSESPNATCIYQYSLDGLFIKKWECIKDAGLSIGLNNSSNISRGLKTKTHQAYGFLWTDFYSERIEPYNKRNKIYQYTPDGSLINIYENSSYISNEQYNKNKIIDCCNHNLVTYKSFIWLYEYDIKNISFYVRVYKYARYSQKPVAQYDLNNNIINTYVSIYEAEAITNISAQLIYKNCIGELKTTGYKYIWKYIKCDKLKPEIMNLTISGDKVN